MDYVDLYMNDDHILSLLVLLYVIINKVMKRLIHNLY